MFHSAQAHRTTAPDSFRESWEDTETVDLASQYFAGHAKKKAVLQGYKSKRIDPTSYCTMQVQFNSRMIFKGHFVTRFPAITHLVTLEFFFILIFPGPSFFFFLFCLSSINFIGNSKLQGSSLML